MIFLLVLSAVVSGFCFEFIDLLKNSDALWPGGNGLFEVVAVRVLPCTIGQYLLGGLGLMGGDGRSGQPP